MKHPSDGTLRRLLDDPQAVPLVVKDHALTCEICRASMEAIRSDAAHAEAIFSGTGNAPSVDSAYRRFLSAQREGKSPGIRLQGPARPWMRPATVGAVVFALAGVLAFTPVGSFAAGLLTIFEPQTVAPVPVSPGAIASAVKGLQAFGTLQGNGGGHDSEVASAAQAGTTAGLDVLVPGWLPSGLGSATYTVTSGRTLSFTFSQQKAEAWAAQQGQTLSPMPTGMDGATLYGTFYPGEAAVYGITTSGSAPQLVIAETKAPVVTSSGPTVTEISGYLASIPGISPELKADIQSFGNPTSVLPIPIPITKASGQTVTIQGVQGVAVDLTGGLGAGVVWEKGGVIYTVAGQIPLAEILQIASSLH